MSEGLSGPCRVAGLAELSPADVGIGPGWHGACVVSGCVCVCHGVVTKPLPTPG